MVHDKTNLKKVLNSVYEIKHIHFIIKRLNSIKFVKLRLISKNLGFFTINPSTPSKKSMIFFFIEKDKRFFLETSNVGTRFFNSIIYFSIKMLQMKTFSVNFKKHKLFIELL